MIKKFFFPCIVMLGTMAPESGAVPAKPGLMPVRTSDGSMLSVLLEGDEYFHQYFSEDGYPIVRIGEDFYYCDIDDSGQILNSGIKVATPSRRDARTKAYLRGIDKTKILGRLSNISSRSTRRAHKMSEDFLSKPCDKMSENNVGATTPFPKGYGLFPDSKFPAYGDQRALVILVEYQDVKFTLDSPHDYFSRMLNEDGFSDYNASGSVAEYFRFNSSNGFNPSFDVYGPVTLSNPMKYYGGNDYYGNDSNPAAMVVEACNQLDADIDFSVYDRDGDGYVDNVFVFYAGLSEAAGGSEDTVWPHSMTLEQAGYPDLYLDGVKIHTYGCSNEWADEKPVGVGTFIHEFSHVIGLPDLYATLYTGSFSPGTWSTLDAGSYNNDGRTPPLYSAFERYALGWMKPHEINGPVSAVLPSIGENVAGIIRTSRDNEFFLIENRQQVGWDSYIPGHGMLVWHIDYDENLWLSNSVNNVPKRQHVDIKEADGIQTEKTRDGDSFPGSSDKTEFSALTKPAMKTWEGVSLDYPISEIKELPGGIISFKVLEGSEPLLSTTATEASDISSEGFMANWHAQEGFDHILSVYNIPEGSLSYGSQLPENAVALEGFEHKNMGASASCQVTGLLPQNTYLYTVTLSDGWRESEPSNMIEVFTGRRTIDCYSVEALNAEDISDSSFTAAWCALPDARQYQLSVYTKVPNDIIYEVCDFTGQMPECLPDGWTASSNNTYGMDAYSGVSAPSLRLSSNGDNIVTGKYDNSINRVLFWHRGQNSTEDDVIEVYAHQSDDNWALIHSVKPGMSPEGVITDISDIPDNPDRIKIVFKNNDDKGSLAIDDIKIGHGFIYDNIFLEGFEKLNVGDVVSYVVDGLLPDTDYYYTLLASDGNLVSRPGNEIAVHTSKKGGMNSLFEDNSLIINGSVLFQKDGENIIVYDSSGNLIISANGTVSLPGKGMYIIRIPARNETCKVII